MGKEIASRLCQIMRRVPRHTRWRKQIAACAAFGDRLDSGLPNHQTTTPSDAMPHYTGKPSVPGLGYAFLFRNYRASLGKWQTADPMGYPDGWNQLAYCGNGVASAVDLWGGVTVVCVSGKKTVRRLKDINVLESNNEIDGGGSFYANVTNITGFGANITVTIELSIEMDMDLRRNADFAIGEITEYAPHTGKYDNSMGRNGVYEAILAHEKAHAAHFLDYQLDSFKTLLNVSGIDNSTKPEDEILGIIKNCFGSAWNYHASYSNTAANMATYNWFFDHSEWKKIESVGGMDRWIKEARE